MSESQNYLKVPTGEGKLRADLPRKTKYLTAAVIYYGNVTLVSRQVLLCHKLIFCNNYKLLKYLSGLYSQYLWSSSHEFPNKI